MAAKIRDLRLGDAVALSSDAELRGLPQGPAGWRVSLRLSEEEKAALSAEDERAAEDGFAVSFRAPSEGDAFMDIYVGGAMCGWTAPYSPDARSLSVAGAELGAF